MSDHKDFVILTACDHVDQEFYELGRVELEVPAKTLIENIPTGSPHDCDNSSACLILGYWPDEQTTYTSASVILAADALSRTTPGSGIFRGDGLPADPQPLALHCGCADVRAPSV